MILKHVLNKNFDVIHVRLIRIKFVINLNFDNWQFQNGKNASHVTAVVCESDFGLYLAAITVQSNMNFCNNKVRIELSTTEDLVDNIASITGKQSVRWTILREPSGILSS